MVTYVLVAVVVTVVLVQYEVQGVCLSDKSCNGHGTCEKSCTSYGCKCTGNYTGNSCEIPPNCTPNGAECGVHGHCQKNLTCTCINGYDGKFCRIAPTCTDTGNECGLYGECNTCSKHDKDNYCLCHSGYSGIRCTMAPICTDGGNECKNGGWCDFTQRPYNCSCPLEFQHLGDTCGGHHGTVFMTLLILCLLGSFMMTQQ